MTYYRRKPLDVLSADVAAVEATRLAAEGPNALAPNRPGPVFVQPSAVDDIASALPLQTRRESDFPTVAPSAQPQNGSALSPDQSGADLVARAIEILNRDLAAGALAAAGATPFQSAFPALPLDSLPMANGLPGSMGEALNTVLQAVAQRQSPAGTALPLSVPVVGAPGSAEALPATEEVVPLQPAGIAHAGEQATIAFKLHNDSFRPVQFSLQKTDLISPHGHRIPQSEITIAPQDLSLAPDEMAETVITVRIPAATPSGIYSGPLTATALPYLQGIIRVRVD